jgi:hypothetical protein
MLVRNKKSHLKDDLFLPTREDHDHRDHDRDHDKQDEDEGSGGGVQKSGGAGMGMDWLGQAPVDSRFMEEV